MTDYEAADFYQGVCHGGPLDGETMPSRFPKGFLLVARPANKCWLYDWSVEEKNFKVRQEEPMELHSEGDKNRYRAAEEFEYDVIAVSGLVASAT